ncbi:hypothetical protein D3C84_713340 [compost metagenome]
MVSVRQTGQWFEPVTQGISLPGSGECREGSQCQRGQSQPVEFTRRTGTSQIDLRQLIEQFLRFTQMRSAAGHGRRRLGPACSQQRKDLMAQIVARVLSVLIRRIFDPVQTLLGGVDLQFGTGDVE